MLVQSADEAMVKGGEREKKNGKKHCSSNNPICNFPTGNGVLTGAYREGDLALTAAERRGNGAILTER